VFGLNPIRRGGVNSVAVIIVVADHLEDEAVTTRDEDAVTVREAIVNSLLASAVTSKPANGGHPKTGQ
jgi:hypothetical protein